MVNDPGQGRLWIDMHWSKIGFSLDERKYAVKQVFFSNKDASVGTRKELQRELARFNGRSFVADCLQVNCRLFTGDSQSGIHISTLTVIL